MSTQSCPHCGMTVPGNAHVCPYCHYEFPEFHPISGLAKFVARGVKGTVSLAALGVANAKSSSIEKKAEQEIKDTGKISDETMEALIKAKESSVKWKGHYLESDSIGAKLTKGIQKNHNQAMADAEAREQKRESIRKAAEEKVTSKFGSFVQSTNSQEEPIAQTDVIEEPNTQTDAPEEPTVQVQANAQSISAAEQLEKIASLYAKGLLTDEEFIMMKQKILNQ